MKGLCDLIAKAFRKCLPHLALLTSGSGLLQLHHSWLSLDLSESLEVRYRIRVGDCVARLDIFARESLLDRRLNFFAIYRGRNTVLRDFDDESRHMTKRESASYRLPD